MDRCDVLIVGGGPAGSSCAWKLAGLGLDVLVLDRKEFPRDKPCAGWITPPVVDCLRLDLDDYRRGRVLEPIMGFTVGLINGPAAETRYPQPVSYAIRRCEFDDYLLRRAGARLCPGESVRTLERVAAGWLVNGTIRAGLVVGAGGHFCPVARFLGGKVTRKETVIAAQEIEVELDPDQLRAHPIKPGIPNLAFCSDLKGYGWYYRKGNYLNVGLGREDDHKLSDHVSAYVKGLQDEQRIPRNLSARFVGHAYLLYAHSQRPIVEDQVVLIGDAMGVSYSPSGEGIRPAIESGLLAAEVIAAAAGDYRRIRLEPYQAHVRARFGRKEAWSMTDLLPMALKRVLARRLMGWNWFARKVVVDRWFLRAYEPALQLSACATSAVASGAASARRGGPDSGPCRRAACPPP